MAKKTTEKDVLIVRDEKTGEISVVAGLNADGSPKRTPAKAENAQSFLQFDRHGDVLDNFFKNFFRQCKEPSRFGFYRVAADQADKLLEVIKDLLKDPEGNKEMLAPHKVDTSGYEKKVQEEASPCCPRGLSADLSSPPSVCRLGLPRNGRNRSGWVPCTAGRSF